MVVRIPTGPLKSLGGSNLSPDDTESSTRVSVIESVKTPLGLFTLVILVTEAIILAGSTIIGADQLWMPFLIIAIVIVLVFVLAIVRPGAVGIEQITPQPAIIVTMMFPENTNVNFDDDCGELSIKPRTGRKKTEIFTPTYNQLGGWYHTLPSKINPEDQIRISLTDTTGKKWRTKPFVPRSISQELAVDARTDGGG